MNFIVILREPPDKEGKCRICIRWIIKGKPNYLNTTYKVRKDQWNGKEVVNHHNAASLNTNIRTKLADLEKRYIDADTIGQTLSRDHRKIDFHGYAQKVYDRLVLKLGVDKMKFMKSKLKKYKEFKSPLYFSEINPGLMFKLEQFCRDRENSENTVWATLKDFRTIVNSALREGVIKVSPLTGYKVPKYKDPPRKFLTMEEVEQIEKFTHEDHHQSLINTALWFLFSCYSGLRYSDLRNWKQVENWLIIRTKKTGEDIHVKVHPRLKAVIDRLPEEIYTNQKFNDHLKTIAGRLKIDKPLSYHISRHAFSVLFLKGGGSMEGLSKLLGHSSLRSTQIYGKVVNSRLDEEMDKVWGK